MDEVAVLDPARSARSSRRREHAVGQVHADDLESTLRQPHGVGAGAAPEIQTRWSPRGPDALKISSSRSHSAS